MPDNLSYLKVFNSLPDYVSLIDPKDNTIIDLNNAYLKKTGLSRNNSIGKKCYEVIHKRFSPCGSSVEKCPLKETLKTHNTAKAEHIHYDKNNNPYYIEVITSFVKDPVNKKNIILHVCRRGSLVKKFDKVITEKGKKYLSQLKDLAIKDHLTGVHNYRYFMERLPEEVLRAKRYNDSISLAIVDIDYFKSINDAYGHKIGDVLLTGFVVFLKKSLRSTDMLARYSGEEFMILMPHTDRLGAQFLADRLITRISGHNFKIDGISIRIKISIGIATLSQESSSDTHEKLLGAVDKALGRAKDAGGNTARAYSELYEDKKISRRKISTYEEVNFLKRKIKKLSGHVDQVVLESIYAFSKSLEARDYYTAEHAEEMVSLVLKMGKELGLSGQILVNLERGAMLHDLGKIGISDEILRKKSKLTPEEYRIIKNHPKIGAEIIRAIHFLKEVVPIVLHHHENWNGKGYPSGLKDREIPLLARIVSIADAYQALVSDRPYRKAYPKKEALKILKEESGVKFDKDLVNLLIRLETIRKHARKA
jgi:diguanylate cyclase (GGDEF)-like protein/putative nucleotidyltransferase with HDIG domain